MGINTQATMPCQRPSVYQEPARAGPACWTPMAQLHNCSPIDCSLSSIGSGVLTLLRQHHATVKKGSWAFTSCRVLGLGQGPRPPALHTKPGKSHPCRVTMGCPVLGCMVCSSAAVRDWKLLQPAPLSPRPSRPKCTLLGRQGHASVCLPARLTAPRRRAPAVDQSTRPSAHPSA
jgi:hypothetical protein